MNLNEDINRIKEIMDIGEPSHTVPQDTVAIKSTIQSYKSNNATPTKYIYLTPRDAQGNVIGNKLTYAISAEYKFFEFDVQIRNISRSPSGNLYVEAKPNNSVVNSTLQNFASSTDLTKDGWLKVNVPTSKINAAITKLKKSNSASIDAGNGVTIVLTNV